MDNKTIEKDVVTEYLEIEDQLRELEANYRTTQNKLLNYKSLNSLKQKKTKKIVGWILSIFPFLYLFAVFIMWLEIKMFGDANTWLEAKKLENMKSELWEAIFVIPMVIIVLIVGIILIRQERNMLKRDAKQKEQYKNEINLILTALEMQKNTLLEKQAVLSNTYKRSYYYQITHTEMEVLRTDSGMMGEYLISEKIKPYIDNGARLLLNLYIPCGGNRTTEIDILMICKIGIIVFESKNFSGWIGGREEDTQWTQVLRNERGREWREKFYNPVLQNQLHIDSLKKIVGDKIPMYSMVVFSDKCILNKKFVSQKGVCVIQCSDVPLYVKLILEKNHEKTPDNVDVLALYDKLIPYVGSCEDVKQRHIEGLIRDRIKNV